MHSCLYYIKRCVYVENENFEPADAHSYRVPKHTHPESNPSLPPWPHCSHGQHKSSFGSPSLQSAAPCPPIPSARAMCVASAPAPPGGRHLTQETPAAGPSGQQGPTDQQGAPAGGNGDVEVVSYCNHQFGVRKAIQGWFLKCARRAAMRQECRGPAQGVHSEPALAGRWKVGCEWNSPHG